MAEEEHHPKEQERLVCVKTLLPPLKQVGLDDNNNITITYREPQPAWQCTFSRDGHWLAVAYGSPDPCIRIWNNNETSGASEKKEEDNNWILHSTLSGIHTRTVRSVAFAPLVTSATTPLVLASASFDGTVAIWELFVDPENTSVKQQQKQTWDCTAQLEGHDSEVKCVVWNATATLLATCGRDKTVWIWECFLPGTIGGSSGGSGGGGDFECLAVLNGHAGDVKCVQFAANHGHAFGDGDDILFSASYDDSIRLWAQDAGDWYMALTLSAVHASTIWTLAVAPSSCRLVSGSADGSLAFYKCYNNSATNNNYNNNSAEWKCVGKLEQAHGDSAVYSVHYAPARSGHGRLASGGADNRIAIYREATGSTSDKPLFELDASVVPTSTSAADAQSGGGGSGGDVNCVCWHPWDGRILASASDDGAVRLWHYNSSGSSSCSD